ncbi:hypothetical protein DPMN_090312 [Dreissena polymorpha]|uniref:Uncharacterized protein n=1 Tax=Dreissena polymorpha TaxID=45954 RepID=A0A9D4KZY6_DREPO|nr:hypothetical protein DPMN_090312 [Dreissena polymorpha]
MGEITRLIDVSRWPLKGPIKCQPVIFGVTNSAKTQEGSVPVVRDLSYCGLHSDRRDGHLATGQDNFLGDREGYRQDTLIVPPLSILLKSPLNKTNRVVKRTSPKVIKSRQGFKWVYGYFNW